MEIPEDVKDRKSIRQKRKKQVREVLHKLCLMSSKFPKKNRFGLERWLSG